MKEFVSKTFPDAQAYLVPFSAPAKRLVSLGAALDTAVDALIESGRFHGNTGELETLILPVDGQLKRVAALGLGEALPAPRKLFLSAAKALRGCKDWGAKSVAIALDNAPALCGERDLLYTLARLPELVSYTNAGHKSAPKLNAFDEVCLVSAQEVASDLLDAAVWSAQGTLAARRLVNLRASDQTPRSLADDIAALGRESGFDVECFGLEQIKALGMESFLAVARGAIHEPPVLIVMRYLHGGDSPIVGYIGKGIVYDSGGYSLKSGSGMRRMFNDMGGAAAVAGAMSAIARCKLPVNVVGVIAACENKLTAEAYLPGDIIGSMAGKSIEVISTDAEGRLTLADALTYAIRKENCAALVDVATLTGAARGAVGRFSAAVMANDDRLFDTLRTASRRSCEKVWRLDLDEEMRFALNSSAADLRNSGAESDVGGGCILGGLFLEDFAEKRPWAHIDIAPVNFRADGTAFSAPGATGYGAALLFSLAQELPEFVKGLK